MTGPVRELPKINIDVTQLKPLAPVEAPPEDTSPMLLEGTESAATENEYVIAIGAAILKHACKISALKMKLANGSFKKVPVWVLNEHALAHVLKVFLAGGEQITDEMLEWKPPEPEKPAVSKIIKAGV